MTKISIKHKNGKEEVIEVENGLQMHEVMHKAMEEHEEVQIIDRGIQQNYDSEAYKNALENLQKGIEK